MPKQMPMPCWSVALTFASITLAACAPPPPPPPTPRPPEPVCVRGHIGAPSAQPRRCQHPGDWDAEAEKACFDGPGTRSLGEVRFVEPCPPGPDGGLLFAGVEFTCCTLPDPPIRPDAGVDRR